MEPHHQGHETPVKFGRLARRLWSSPERETLHIDVDRWRSMPRLYGDVDDALIAGLRRRDGVRAERTVRAAERVCVHEFDLLGSGRFTPVDPDRPAVDGYQPIDWYLDPVRRLRFPRGIPYKSWKLYEMRPGLADIKYPWELARCQHWVALGQAFRLSGDDRFVREIANELRDFVEANPVGVGINWTSTMDVALRAVNWVLGLELVKTSGALDEAFHREALRALAEHGRFIRANLENTYEVTSNHFLSNVVGLWFLGAVFADTPPGREWTAFARHALEHELEVQVLPDGADYESSVPYHRLVAELFLGAARLGDAIGAPLSAGYRSRLGGMAAFHAAVLRPDGLMPQVGDADDGRLHVFTDYGGWLPQDGRHLLAAAGAMFGDTGWLEAAGDLALWEAAWWGLSSAGPQPGRGDARPARARLFPHAGVAVAGDAVSGTYLIITNGVVGTNGFGNHKHNDQLSFELHAGGAPLIVDPGSFVYTSDSAARNRFRGTSCHNTITIDGVEQNEIKPEWLFRMFETSRAEHVSFSGGEDTTEYVGRHHGYERLAKPVTHERAFRFEKASGRLQIADRLLGTGEHELRWHFHIAPGVSVEHVGDDVLLSRSGRQWRLGFPAGLDVSLSPDQYSPSYGVRLTCMAINFTIFAAIDRTLEWCFVVEPSRC
jgi:uncharacterized heparinase superfamily protein